MAEEKDFNDLVDDIFMKEETLQKASYAEGFKAGSASGNPEGFHLGYHRGAELGRELGYYLGVITYYIENNDTSENKLSDKVLNQLTKVKESIKSFPQTNADDEDILGLAENIRAQYKKACALLKVKDTEMESTILKVQHQLDAALKFLTPLLPVANCHMVEFLTEKHWEKLVPAPLREALEKWDFNYAVETFWRCCRNEVKDNTEINKWVRNAQAHYIKVNNEYCLNTDQLQERIASWGGQPKPEITIKEFMPIKKSYEVGIMSRMAASLFEATSSTCCLEVGGGKGALLSPLSVVYRLRSLTVDCQEHLVKDDKRRQKQLQSLSRLISNSEENSNGQIYYKLHRFAQAYVTRHTDIDRLVKENFPEFSLDESKVLLTGLHTCGNLGPDSLRIFLHQSSIKALFNVPCCYHLLTEDVDEKLFDVFQRNYGGNDKMDCGFPMSKYLKGYNLGRNARMLASQSIDRVVHQKGIPAKSLLYRAMLQTIIKDYIPEQKLLDGKLKRIGPKCETFEQYYKMADEKLNLNLHLPENYFQLLSKNLDIHWKNLVMFNFLRLCLAQVVESVILLDRLLFLYENEFKDVYLVKLFDPVLSPRCHAIVVVR